jgi:diguanylate cyclase (GGDEF)-like protein
MQMGRVLRSLRSWWRSTALGDPAPGDPASGDPASRSNARGERRRLAQLLLASLLLLAGLAQLLRIAQLQRSGTQLLALAAVALSLVLLLQAQQQRLSRSRRQLRHLQRSTRSRALVDELTDLPNRRAFLDQITVASDRARRSKQAFAVLFIDIDQFRSLNDTYGHITGDRALLAVARKLRQTVRLSDVLARYGSDEFAVLMDLSGLQQSDGPLLRAHAFQFASRLVSQFREATDLGDTCLDIGVSVGVSVVEPTALTPEAKASPVSNAETILRNLDAAIAQAKQQNHERVAIFDVQASGNASPDDYQLFSDLKEALRQRQLQMAFQPLVGADGSWWSLEALARWVHPTLGPIPPDRFIPLAERYRLMGELGDLIFALSLEGYNSIRSALRLSDLRLSVNISPTQLSDPQLHERLGAMLAVAAVSPQLITLEITEASVLERNPATEANLQQFRRQGYQLALDDFGTGYSSLNLLNTLQPNEVKIDKSFVLALESDLYASQIVAVLAGMAGPMHLHLVAEGVENASILSALQAMGVTLFQGYHFWRPMPAGALISSATGSASARP